MWLPEHFESAKPLREKHDICLDLCYLCCCNWEKICSWVFIMYPPWLLNSEFLHLGVICSFFSDDDNQWNDETWARERKTRWRETIFCFFFSAKQLDFRWNNIFLSVVFVSLRNMTEQRSVTRNENTQKKGANETGNVSIELLIRCNLNMYSMWGRRCSSNLHTQQLVHVVICCFTCFLFNAGIRFTHSNTLVGPLRFVSPHFLC